MSTPTINEIAFSISWTTTYRSLLDAASDPLLTRSGYAAAFEGRAGTFQLPWESYEREHWSRFWAFYLAAPWKLRQLSADAGWDYVIPLEQAMPATVVAPEGTSVEAAVRAYPAATSVIIRGVASGSWPLGELAAALESIRNSRSWGLTTPEKTSTNRNLDGIAEDLRAALAPASSNDTQAVQGAPTIVTVAAPLAGTGTPEQFDLADKVAGSCLAGLSVLGPPGTLVAKYLLDANTDSRRGARIYALRDGHAIWHPTRFLGPPENQAVKCLLDNHTDLVSHIAALSGLASWAGERLDAHAPIALSLQPLIKQAAMRLLQLHAGVASKTYRAGVAKARIEPMLPALNTISATL